MTSRERRKAQQREIAALRAGLTPEQLKALDTLEHFQWTLKFVRRPLFLHPMPLVVDREGARHAVLRADGSLDEDHGLQLRD